MTLNFTNNHFATAHEALTEANKVLASNGLPLFTYGSSGGGGSGKQQSMNKSLTAGGGEVGSNCGDGILLKWTMK